VFKDVQEAYSNHHRAQRARTEELMNQFETEQLGDFNVGPLKQSVQNQDYYLEWLDECFSTVETWMVHNVDFEEESELQNGI
jgi:hypothetical protein